jgi:hypothetical protein
MRSTRLDYSIGAGRIKDNTVPAVGASAPGSVTGAWQVSPRPFQGAVTHIRCGIPIDQAEILE